jgi:uncharacterized NAD-dependent epimerase/dehydratase family protein
VITLTLRYKAGGQVSASYTDEEEVRAIEDARRYFQDMQIIASSEVTDKNEEQLFYLDHRVERGRQVASG